MFEQTVLFYFPLFLSQRELKFGMGVSLSVAWLERCPSSLEVWVGSCHVVLVPICPGFFVWGGINAPMVLPPDHWNLVTINALVRCVEIWAILKGQQQRFFEAPVLYYRFYQFPPWIEGLVTRVLLPLVISWIVEVTLGNGSS